MSKDKTASDRDAWRTPPYVFWWANKLWGPFDIDLAASTENTKCDAYFTEEDNALDKGWSDAGHVKGWLNPPYSNINPFVEKAIEETKSGFETVMLIPSFNSDGRDARILRFAAEIVLIIGRIQFVPPPGVKPSSNPRGSMLVRFAPHEYLNPDFSTVTRATMRREYEDARLALLK